MRAVTIAKEECEMEKAKTLMVDEGNRILHPSFNNWFYLESTGSGLHLLTQNADGQPIYILTFHSGGRLPTRWYGANAPGLTVLPGGRVCIDEEPGKRIPARWIASASLGTTETEPVESFGLKWWLRRFGNALHLVVWDGKHIPDYIIAIDKDGKLFRPHILSDYHDLLPFPLEVIDGKTVMAVGKLAIPEPEPFSVYSARCENPVFWKTLKDGRNLYLGLMEFDGQPMLLACDDKGYVLTFGRLMYFGKEGAKLAAGVTGQIDEVLEDGHTYLRVTK